MLIQSLTSLRACVQRCAYAFTQAKRGGVTNGLRAAQFALHLAKAANNLNATIIAKSKVLNAKIQYNQQKVVSVTRDKALDDGIAFACTG